MNKITVTGLRVEACHGVLAEEKKTPQPFLFDVELGCDLSQAAESDDLRDTVNYAEVCALVRETALGKSCNLIEKLAADCAFAIMERFPTVMEVAVTVHKPCAPVGAQIADVTADCFLRREKVYLSLGSSMGDKRRTLEGALRALDGLRGVKITKVSPMIETEPYGGVAENTFLNCAAEAECLISPRRLLDLIHKIEEDAGRVRERRWADRTLDIDIVFFGNRVIAEEGLVVPHPDYRNRSFVLGPLKAIAAGFVCPLCRKTIGEM